MNVDPNDPWLGQKLGAIEISALIGVGGVGRVYRARDHAHDRTVAVKIVETDDPKRRERLRREARALGRIEHPHIVRLYEFAETADARALYIVMDLIEGETLQHRLEREPLMPLRNAMGIFDQVLFAVEAAHAIGIVHRDLKPANIILVHRPDLRSGAQDTVIVCDFGLAKSVDPNTTGDRTASGITAHGTILGTPGYLSPEQILGSPVERCSDIYAAGVLLFELVFGQRPFPARTPMEEMLRQVQEDLVALPTTRSLDPASAADLKRVLASALAREPENRCKSVHDLRLEVSSLFSATVPLLVKTARTRRTDPSEAETQFAVARSPSNLEAPSGAKVARATAQGPINFLRRGLILAGVGGAIGAAWTAYPVLRRLVRRPPEAPPAGPLSEMVQILDRGDYQVAENYALSNLDSLSSSEEGEKLVLRAMHLRRQADGRSDSYDPDYQLMASTWSGRSESATGAGPLRVSLIIESVGPHSFRGYLSWPDAPVSVHAVGYHDGNHLLLWDVGHRSGHGIGYRYKEKRSLFVDGSRLTGVGLGRDRGTWHLTRKQ